MDPRVATLGVVILIVWLCRLDRDPERPTSRALWIPVTWLFLCSSRTAAQWLGLAPLSGTSEQLVEGSPIDAAMYFSLLLADVVILMGRRERVGQFGRLNVPLILFLSYCGVSVLWSDFPFVAFKRWIKAVGDVLMILIVLTDIEPTVALKRLFSRAGFALIPLSILLIRYYPTLGRDYSPWTGAAYNIGVATGKNGLGYVALFFGVVSVWRLCLLFRDHDIAEHRGPFVANAITLVLALWVFQMAHSATSFFCFLAGSALIMIASIRVIARERAVIHMIVAAMLFVVVYGLLLNPELGLSEMAGRDPSLTGRTRIWNEALDLTVDPLFGAGYESFWLGDRVEQFWRRNWEHPNQAHNGYLEVYLDLGYVGVSLVGFVMISGYRRVFQALQWEPDSAPLRLAFFFVAAVYNLTEHAFRELHPIWIALLFAIITGPQPLAIDVGESASEADTAAACADLSVAEA